MARSDGIMLGVLPRFTTNELRLVDPDRYVLMVAQID
jgi:hypothetical protein